MQQDQHDKEIIQVDQYQPIHQNQESNQLQDQLQEPPRENQIFPIDYDIIPSQNRDMSTPRPEKEALLYKDAGGDLIIPKSLQGNQSELNQWMQEFAHKTSNQKYQTHRAKKEEQVSNVYSGMILCRRLTRILIQFMLLGIVIGLFAWGYLVTLEVGRWDAVTNPTSVEINVQNCFLNVTESTNQIGFSYIGKGSLFKHVNASQEYVIQGVENNGVATLNFINPFKDVKYCMIELQLPKNLVEFKYSCLKESECLMTIHIESLQIATIFNATAAEKALLSINIRDIDTPHFIFKSLSAGNLFLNHIATTNAEIQLLSGDIVIQSTKDMYLNFTSSSHSFCMSGPHMNSEFTDCYVDETTLDKFGMKCSGKLRQCQQSGCVPTQNFQITSNASTIYSNLLKDIAKPYIEGIDEFEILPAGVFSNLIQFDSDTKLKINTFLNKTITDADITVRLDIGGHYLLQQPQNTYWSYFNNPAYANFLPWWLSVLSATFLGSEYIHIQASTDPGFCPWHPTVTLEQLYEMQTTIKDYFNKSAGTAIYMEKDNRPTALLNLNSEKNYTGVEPLVKKKQNQVEEWFTVVQTADILGLQKLPYDPFFIASVVVSVIASIIFGLMATLAIIVILYSLESYILETTSQYSNYSATTLKESTEKLTSAVKYMLAKLDQLQSKKDPPVMNGIFSYFWYLVAQSYMKNGAKMFCSIIFKKTNPEQTTQYYNGSLPAKFLTIDEYQLKELYEQFCYLNRLTVDQLSAQDQLLEYYGFQIIEKGDAVLLSKLKLKSNSKPYNQLTEIEKISEDSLELFMATQVQITGIAADKIESDQLEKLYNQFCGKVLKKQNFNAKDIANNYGVAISDQKVYVLSKIRSGTQEKQNWFIRMLGRCTHYLPLIEDYYAEQPVYILKTETEVNKFITGPIKTLAQRKGIAENWWSYNFVRMFIESMRFNYKKRLFSREFRFRDGKDEENNVLEEYFDAIYMEGWIWTDIIVVLGNMTINAITILPVVFFLMIVNTTYAPYSLYDPRYLIFDNDIFQRPWSVFDYGFVVDEWVLAGAILLLYYGAVTFLFQTIKYFFSFFPDEVGFMFEFKLYQYRVMKWFNWFQWLQFLLLIFLVTTYFGVIIVWLLLGAIINPNNYLVYSSSAVTLVATMAAEMNSIKQLYTQACEEVKNLISEIYLRTFGQLASNLIKEISRLSDMSVTLINSTGMDQAKDMAEQLGFGEELDELCILTQGMLDNNSASSLNTDQLNFKAIKDKFIAKACEKFIKVAKEQFSVPELIAEQLIHSNFLKFDEIVDTLANQVQVTSGNKIPAALVKWMYATSVHLSRVLKKKSAEDQKKEMQIVLPKISLQMFDAIIEGMMMKTVIDDKGASQQAIKAVLTCMFNITQDKKPANMLRQIKNLFANIKDQVVISSIPIMVLEQSFNYAEALSDPNINIELVQKDLIRQILSLFNLDGDISSVFQVLFLKQSQLIEKGQVLSATEIAGQLIRVQEKFFELPEKNKPTFDLFVLAAIKYLKNDKAPLQEFVDLVGDDNGDAQQLLEINQQWLNTILSLITLASKSWKDQLTLQVKGTNLEYTLGTLDIATKYIWSTQHSESGSLEQKKPNELQEHQQEDWSVKTFKKAAAKLPQRMNKLIGSDLVELIAHPFAMTDETLIGLILFLRGEMQESVYHESIYRELLKYVAKDANVEFTQVKVVLEILSVRNFEEVQMMIPMALMKSLFHLTFADRTTYEILEGNRLLKIYRDTTKYKPYEKLGEVFTKKQEFVQIIQRIENTLLGVADKEIVNYYKSEKVSFYTYLKKTIQGEQSEKGCKNEFLTEMKNVYSLKFDYLLMLLEIQQSLHDQQSINMNLLPGLKVEPLQNLLKIMSFKDTQTVCKGIEYFLNLNPSITVNLGQLSDSLQIFVEIEAIISSIQLPNSIPYYFQKIWPLFMNNILGTRIALSPKVFRDLSSILLQDLPEPLSFLKQYQQNINLFIDVLFEQNLKIKSNQLLKLIELLTKNNVKQTDSEKKNNDKIRKFMMAVFMKDYDKLLEYLGVFFQYIKPEKYRNFFKKVSSITRGLTSIKRPTASSTDTVNLVWATQQLKYFISYDQDAFMELINSYFGKVMGGEKANMTAINALFSLFSDKPDMQMLVSLYQIEEDLIILLKFLVEAIVSDKKSNLLQNPEIQMIAEKKLGLKNLEPIIDVSDILEQNVQEIPRLMNKLKLDTNLTGNKLFISYLTLRMQIKHTGSWNGNIQKYQEQVFKRQQYLKSDIEELVLQFSNAHPLNMMYAFSSNQFLEPNEKVAQIFSAIASITKYDFSNTFAKRQPEQIKHKSNKIQQLEQKSVEKALNFIAGTSESDLVEGLLLLQLATGLNPVLTSGIMNQNNCLQNAMSNLTPPKQAIIQKFLSQLESYEKVDAFNRFYIVEYETAKIAVSVENDGKEKDLASQLQTSKLVVQSILNLSSEELEIVEGFLQSQNKGKLPINFPLSSAVMIFALKDLRQIKQNKEAAVPAYLKGVHLIDLILTVYEKYLYFYDIKLLAQLNKPMLTRLLSFGLFDSPKFRRSQLNQNLIENMLYPSLSDIMVGQKYNNDPKLNYCLGKQDNFRELAKFFIENQAAYIKIMFPLVRINSQAIAIEKSGDYELESRWLDFQQTWTSLFTLKNQEKIIPPKLMSSEPNGKSVSDYYDQLIQKMPNDPSLEYIKLQNQLIQKLSALNLNTIGHLRTKYYDKCLDLTKKNLLKPSEMDILNSDQVFESQEQMISNLLKFYAGQYQIEQSKQDIQPKQSQPTPKVFYSYVVLNEGNVPQKFRGKKSKKPINLNEFIDSLLALNLNDQERRDYKFIIDLLYNPKQINIDELNKLWDGQQVKMNCLMMMLVRMQLEQSKQEGRFAQLANKVPSCFLYFSIGDQYENMQELETYKSNNKAINLGMDELIEDCTEIQAKIRAPLKLLIRCYLGDVEAWYTLIAISRNQNSLETDLLSENMIHTFILEFLLQLKNMGLRNAKIGRTQLVSQSFLKVLTNQPDFNLKSTFECVLMQTFEQAKQEYPDQICQQFTQYLDFIVDGNISVLKMEFMNILQGIFMIENKEWKNLKFVIQFLMQLLFKGDSTNENFEEFENLVSPKLPQEEWKLAKILIEVQHSNDLKIIIKKLIEYISSNQEFKVYAPYITTLASLNAIQNLKFLPQKKEDSAQVVNLLLYPVFMVCSQMKNQAAEMGPEVQQMIQFCTSQIEKVDLKLVEKILNHNEAIEQSSKDSSQILMTQENVDYYVQGFKIWCQNNAESNFKIVLDTLTKLFDLNQFPAQVQSIIKVVLALIYNEDPKTLMNQFVGDLTSHKNLAPQKKVIIAATVGLSKINQVKQIKEPEFKETVINLLSDFGEVQKLATILLNFYVSEKIEDLKDLPIVIQQVCFTGELYKDKFKDIPLQQLFTIASQGLIFVNAIQNLKNADEKELLILAKPVFEPMFRNEELKDLNMLIKCLESFIAIKNKKFNEINQEFFQIMKISQQNSQLLVKMMQDFQKALDTPQKMIKDKMAQFVSPGVVRQMQYVNSVTQKLNDNRELSYEDMFRIVDKNGQRLVPATEVLQFIRRINIQITDHKFREIIVQVKQEQVIVDTCMIDIQDFKEIMDQISLQTMYLALEYIGISRGMLIKGLIVLIIYLILVIAFILIGVKAFAIPGTFASIINSILPLLGGFALNRSAVEERMKSLNSQRVQEIVKKAVRVLQTARI